MKPSHRQPMQHQRGVATLVVVLVLFFIVSMVAAYTNRNLIFEQRTAANQYRSTLAMETAQAGLEWAKAMLNHGRITATCQPSTSTTDTSFRERYLSADANGLITIINVLGTTATATNVSEQLTPSCVFNGTGWDCDCPSNAAPSLTPPTGDAVRPAFRVRMVRATVGGRPGMVRIEAVGCTRLSSDCLSFLGQGETSEGRAIATELVALAGGLPSPPLAALTAGGGVDVGGAAMALYNPDRDSGGTTIQAVGPVNTTNLVLSTVPGSPGAGSVIDNDTTLPNSADRMFSGVFNMWPATYQLQPATVVLDATSSGCSAGGCTAAGVRTALSLNPGRVIWITGDLTVDSAGDIGSATAPALLIVNGDLSFTTAATVYGLVYTRTGTWLTAGTGTVRGAVVAEGHVSGTGTPNLVYDADVLRRLRLGSGSFVLVSGGWKDFCSTGTGAITTGGLGC